ncbi:MAG: M28 family peptidase [Gemmatimonadetes bacterium]|nr:M28 family peptidase [Gemmatimonadota bacterium]
MHTLVIGSAAITIAATAATAQRAGQQAAAEPDPVMELVGRLDLERYKATIKGLTEFGDRRQGTDRNRAAVDWIEAQLRSYGCQNVERIRYEYNPAPPAARGGGQAGAGAGAGAGAARGGRAGGAAGGAGRGAGQGTGIVSGPGGSRIRGLRARTGVNNDSLRQPDTAIRAINMQPTSPGMREQVVCTKVGTTRPDEMYIVGGHMDGHGWGQAANDDGSGSAIVMELARIFSMPDVQTDRSIRFALWNNEETGLNGARAYIEQRETLQGKENPVGSGRFPEPKWLGMIQHDMMLFDHGMPRADGTLSPEQRPEADVNVEFQINSMMADASMKLAFVFHGANQKYATDYPVAVGPNMTNTDSGPFQDLIPAISLRENERGAQIGGGWDPNWHQPTDVYTTFSDKDFRLGLNAAQTTMGAIGTLTGAKLKN